MQGLAVGLVGGGFGFGVSPGADARYGPGIGVEPISEWLLGSELETIPARVLETVPAWMLKWVPVVGSFKVMC